MIDQLKGSINRMKVLIADDVHPALPDGLMEYGHQVLYLPNANREEIIKNLSDVQVLVIRTKTPVDSQLLESGPKLKLIARAGAGIDNIDLNYTEQKGIVCLNAGEANSEAVGEHSLGMLLMLLNNLSRAHQQVKSKIWLREENRGVELAGKTVAIIGYGNTGKAFANKLRGMGVQILVYDKYLSGFGNDWVQECNWDRIYAEADMVTFHVPLNAETKYYLDAERLAKFKKPVFVLNLSRGKVVNTENLVEALKSKKVLGCALDVLENEDLKSLNKVEKETFEFLANHEMVVLSPHIAGWTKESYHKISLVLLDKLLTFSRKV